MTQFISIQYDLREMRADIKELLKTNSKMKNVTDRVRVVPP